MTHIWDYDSSVDALTRPGQATDFFTNSRPYAPPALCAEMARLVYCSDLDRVSSALGRAGFRGPVWFRAEGTDAFLAESADVAVLAFRGTQGPNFGRLLEAPSVQALMQSAGGSWQQAAAEMMAGRLPDLRDLFERALMQLQNLFTDLDFLPHAWAEGGKVHRGFALALARVWDDIAPHLDRLETPVLFTGHSLGAALATLAASRRAPDTLYTYGSPTVGNADFAATLEGVAIHRYVNCCDAVCRIPPALYDHIGTLHYIDSAGALVEAEEPDAARWQARSEHFRANSGQWDKVWIRDLADHAPVNYRRAIERA